MKEGTVIKIRVLQLNFGNINRLTHGKSLDRKSGQCAGVRTLAVLQNRESPSRNRESPFHHASIDIHGVKRDLEKSTGALHTVPFKTEFYGR